MTAPRARPGDWLRAAPASTALVALQVVALGLVAWRLGPADDPLVLVRAGALERSRVWAGQPWRLLSGPLLHVGWAHLLANTVFGYGWYRLVEGALGSGRFLRLWVLAALGGSAASLLAQDAVSAGASGALFGMVGATLALHRRALPGWRDFFTSPVFIRIGVSVGVYTAVTVVAHLPIDHAGHAGGFATGALAAWIGSTPRWRHVAWPAFLAALAACCLWAAWPRTAPTGFQLAEAERGTFEALAREDVAGATAAARPLEQDGWRGPSAQLARGALLEARGELAAAVEVLRPLTAPAEAPTLRAAASRYLFRIGYRYYTGEGTKQDPPRGYAAIRDACAGGEETACRAEAEIRTGVPSAAP